MDLLEMVVDGACTKNKPYEFTASGNGLTGQIVNMVMPLGGVESGMYRSPKVGEAVLVAFVDSSSKYYLMGYLPKASDQNFNKKINGSEDASEVIDGLGEVLRYKKTGQNDPVSDEYSEIGFYNKETNWKLSASDTAFPKVDTINIHSTGDIHESAVNYHQIDAKRLAILSNCAEGGKDASDHGDFDRAGDDSTLYEGDIHIRANNRIIIKAGASICLQVGRSTITIDDSGISISSKKMHSNIENLYDSSITVSSMLGINMYGTFIMSKTIYGASIEDNFGGEVVTNCGIVRVNGKDIAIKSFNMAYYIRRNIAYGLMYTENLASSVSSMCGADAGTFNGTANKIPAIIGKMGYSVLPFLLKTKLFYTRRDKSAVELENTRSAIDHIFFVFKYLLWTTQRVVFTVLDAALFPALDLSGGTRTTEENEARRDILSLVSMVVEFPIAMYLFKGVSSASMDASPLHTSFLHLTASAEAILVAYKNKILNTQGEAAQGPLAALEIPAAGDAS
ncbi:MAG: hypothetical protein LBC27_04650 [Spirochaetaceae bacterium]|jgi:hypothetical protein|nr:hypothetical protein [Spirochaetaceae bacterium]